MAATVRAKMRCVKSEATTYSDGTKTHSVVLIPVMEGSAENKEFFRWTPGGQIQLGVMNPAAGAAFQEGVEYYVDFTPATQ